jgi:DNA adenine methylase
MEAMEPIEAQKSESAPAAHEKRPTAIPFIKMAGGKRKLLPALEKHVPSKFDRYLEPMMGGAALYYHLWSSGRLEGCEVVLADASPLLCELYTTIRDGVGSIIPHLQAHARVHGKDHYLEIRDRLGTGNLAERAADILYLSRTCFNGLLRFSKRLGRFNTPMGRYANPTICDEKRLRAASLALQSAIIVESDVETTLSTYARGAGDFIYIDPPYLPRDEPEPPPPVCAHCGEAESDHVPVTAGAPASVANGKECPGYKAPKARKKTKAFSAYTKEDFSLEDHARLAASVRRVRELGAEVLVSQSDAKAIRELYEDFVIEEVLAKRSINSVVGGRGHVTELLIHGRRPS